MYHLPQVEDLFATLAGGNPLQSKTLLMRMQIPLDEESKQYMLPLTPKKDCLDTTDYHLMYQQHPLSSREQWKGCFKDTSCIHILR